MLTLAEEILLLALDDSDGSFHELPEYSLQLAIAGAVMMELALRDRIDSDLHKLMVVDETPTGDDLLDPVLAELCRSENRLAIRDWVLRLARAPYLERRALERLVERGVLRREHKKFLWVFGSRRYPVVDEREQREAKLRVLDVVLGDSIPEPRDIVLICLAQACSLFETILEPGDRARAARRIGEVTRMDQIGREMLGELRDLRAFVDQVGWWGVGQESWDPDSPLRH